MTQGFSLTDPGTGTASTSSDFTELSVGYELTGGTSTAVTLTVDEDATISEVIDKAEAGYDHSLVESGNPHSVTKTEIGLGNCDNTSDAGKPISTATQTALNAKQPYDYHGVETIGAISFVDASKSLVIASVKYWLLGTVYESSGAIGCNIEDFETPTANTLYYFYFDTADGVMKCADSAWDLSTDVPIATVFWNGTNGAVSYEAHGYMRDIGFHKWAHSSIGARYGSGLALTNPTTANDALLSIGSGVIYDEDLQISISAQTTCRVLYQVSAGVYTWVNSSLPYAGTSGQPKFLDTDTYALANVGSSDFAVMWVYATSDQGRPIYIIPTHAATAYNTIGLARTELAPNLINLNLSPEFKLIYKFIYKGDGNFQEYVDYRTTNSVVGGGIPAMAAASVSFSPSGTIAATTVQSAIEELDSEKTTYEKGTWSMGVSFGGASVGVTYQSGYETGYYQKKGDECTVTGFCLLTSKGSSSGNARITGLPFLVANSVSAYSAVSLRLNLITFANAFMGYVEYNATSILLEEVTEAGAVTQLTDADFVNTSAIMVCATYRTA